jgi:bifunctional non-homologous end joining protein LigD
LREDKSPREITRERPVHTPDRAASNGPNAGKHKRQATKTAAAAKGSAQVAGVTISNPDRVVYPDVGMTKLDLARYYEAVAEWVLPHVVNRPLTLVRCPQGSHKPCFYQRHLTESMPKPLRGVKIEEKDGSGDYVVLDDLKGLVSLVQMGVMEIHPWGSRADDIERPDRLVFDLDPGEGADWKAVVEGARLVHDYLDHIGLASFLRTSGGKGLHVVVPLTRRSGWDEIRQFTESFALSLVRAFPDRYIATMSKAKRRGKVFIDYLRNQRGATAVASYSTRAKPGATVATPLRWDELSPKVTSDQLTVATVPQRLAALKADPWDGFFSARQRITAKMQAAAKAS